MTSFATSCAVISLSTSKRRESKEDTCPLQLLIGQADAILHPHFVTDAAILAENGDALHLDPVLDNARRVTTDGRRRPLDPGPSPHAAVPPDDRIQHARVVFDLGVFQDDRLLDADTGADDGAGTDRDVRTKFGARIDVGCGVDEHWRQDVR